MKYETIMIGHNCYKITYTIQNGEPIKKRWFFQKQRYVLEVKVSYKKINPNTINRKINCWS